MNKEPEIKLFITDIDGVWTDGGMFYNAKNLELKKFNTSDSVGVLFLSLLGIPTAIITGENTNIVKRRANKLEIQYCFLGVNDKVKVTESLIRELGISWHEVAYIGDDINDILLLRKVGLSAAPYQAPEYVKKEVRWVIPVKGGDGAFRAFVEKYLNEKGLLERAIEKYFENKSFSQ